MTSLQIAPEFCEQKCSQVIWRASGFSRLVRSFPPVSKINPLLFHNQGADPRPACGLLLCIHPEFTNKEESCTDENKNNRPADYGSHADREVFAQQNKSL